MKIICINDGRTFAVTEFTAETYQGVPAKKVKGVWVAKNEKPRVIRKAGCEVIAA